MSNEFDEETATNENDNYYLEVEYFALIISYRLATIDIRLVGVSRYVRSSNLEIRDSQILGESI